MIASEIPFHNRPNDTKISINSLPYNLDVYHVYWQLFLNESV